MRVTASGVTISQNTVNAKVLKSDVLQRKQSTKTPPRLLRSRGKAAGECPGVSRRKRFSTALGKPSRDTVLGSALERSASVSAAAHVQVADRNIVYRMITEILFRFYAIGSLTAHSAAQLAPEAMALLMTLGAVAPRLAAPSRRVSC